MAWPTAMRSGTVLAIFVGLGLTLVAGVYELTRDRILAAEQQVVLDRLEAVLPTGYDNEPADAHFERPSPIAGGPPARVYPAYAGERYLGAAIEAETPEGYAGPIRLLVGIDAEQQVVAVRVISHRETPGLGDGIEASRSDWIEAFAGRTLGDPEAAEWKLRGDGGAFDGITGATVSARAVVAAVRQVLEAVAADPEAFRGEPPETAAGGEDNGEASGEA
ncbi:hypothetical protein CKO15_06995 [Halorhodospira abdelmalekii]|uniref:RnfABCDGE type electron transport complex subunit G n=1 Tax=Halorhodospira abdelmalekii TaxID=421629 RepID=UPI0019065CE0|nr:RnfABCDGE type electron transport complex subunit G [Halorhodospira abdelmalekii]MBK1735034.1 hypothetical protein [Halorhodospira abdelmalekii]